MFYNLFGEVRYATRHSLPVEESLPLYSGCFHNCRDELDALPKRERAEIGVELRGLAVLDVVVYCLLHHIGFDDGLDVLEQFLQLGAEKFLSVIDESRSAA